ncbi:MAG: hypothetical protein V4527_18890 [Pseudomonadota bacterium]
MPKPCPCGSNHPRYELRDAAGIFCAFVCVACEAEKRRHYDPSIFEAGTPYARTGEEDDIGRSNHGDY